MSNQNPTQPEAAPKNDRELAAQLLAKHKARQAERDAQRAETEKRKAAEKAIRDARKAAGEKVKTPEEKAADFKRLATPRTNKAIKAIRQLAPLSAKGSYAFTDQQVNIMRSALNKAVEETMAQFIKSDAMVEGITL